MAPMTARTNGAQKLRSDLHPPRKLSVGFLFAPDFNLISLSLFTSALTPANDSKDLEATVCSLSILSSPTHPIRLSSGFAIEPDHWHVETSEFSDVAVNHLHRRGEYAASGYKFDRASCRACRSR